MKLSVIIPTKNRHKDLQTALNSIICQEVRPDEIIIVDQSNESFETEKIAHYQDLLGADKNFKYLYDPTIQGLVHAKSEGVNVAQGDVICFLEDDVVLENDYFKEVINGFNKCYKMVGCCGVVTNPPKSSLVYLFLHNFFHIGIYKDSRPSIFANYTSFENDLIQSNAISGGLSAWKSEVFKRVQFDYINGFHMLEDIEFSTRVAEQYPDQLYINTKVRLAHYFSPSGREAEFHKQRRKAIEYILFYKKRKEYQLAMFDMYWLFIGLFLSTLVTSIRYRNTQAIKGIMEGIIAGKNKKVITL
ncbi:MAG: glycosyltransferase family 2 protein [Chitinophagaceae bacterium]|nr:glycosyltransferase family 2 protein [Chitinophagaceae bacterium]